jgi:hypothetical protein
LVSALNGNDSAGTEAGSFAGPPFPFLRGPAAVSGSAENEFTALRIVYALSGEPGFALKALTCF